MKGRYKIGLARILLLLLFPLLVLNKISAATINSITYPESNIGQINFRIISQTSYYDGTILLRLSYPSSTINCNEPKLFLRLIHLDGSIKELNIDVPQIPSENFCLSSTNLENDLIKVYAMSSDFILVKYHCDLSSNKNFCGLVINWDGNILNNHNFEVSCNDDEIVQSINTGFLWACYIQESSQYIQETNQYTHEPNQLFWNKFSAPDTSGSFKFLASGMLTVNNTFISSSTRIFATENGGYGLVTKNQTTSSNPWIIRVTFIHPKLNEIKGPFQIYNMENVQRLDIYKCNIAYYSYGYSCIINVVRTGGRTNFVNIDFSSSGSVLNTTEFVVDDDLVAGSTIWDILPLYYGGLLVLAENGLNKNINGLIFNNNGLFGGYWDIPTGQYNITKSVGIFPNDTIWAVSKFEGDNSWIFVTSSLLSDHNIPYGNALVESTIPPINSTVALMSTQNLQIKFINPVQLSDGSLSIIDDNNIIRQSVNNSLGDFIGLVDDRTVEIKILESTFNRKNTLYYVLVDNGFVKDAKYDQELLGIRKGIWIFSTDNNLEEKPYLSESLLGSTKTIIRLTSDGTLYFTSLSNNERDQFLKDLASDLSLIIPCDIGRLSIESRYQFDKDSTTQILLLVNIKKESNDKVAIDNVSSSQIAKDLNLLITNRDYNDLSRVKTTSLLDASYGAIEIPNLWRRFRYILIVVAAGFLILIILYIMARKAHTEANNKVIFTFTLIVIDFILDALFVSIYGYDLSWLYPTSVVFIIMPIILNLIFTYIILSKEIKDNNKFSKWWMKNTKTALLFTLLSGVDLEALNVISSQCFRSTKLNAVLTTKTEYHIFLINSITILIEDVPQFLILVLYQEYTILPSIIPILTLSSCTIVLLTKLICLIIYLKHRRESKIPCKSFEKRPDRLEITIRGFNNKQLDKNDNFTDLSPILPPLPEDFHRKKPKRSFFGSGQYSVDSKRNSTNSNSSYFPEALRIFTSSDNNNSGNGGNDNNTHSDLAERITVLNEGNFFGRNERTGEPIFLLRDPADYDVQKIKQLSHGKLVGDSIVSANKISPGILTSGNNNLDKRLSDVGIICSTVSDDNELGEEERSNNDNDEEVSVDQDDDDDNNTTEYSGSYRPNSRSTTNRTSSTSVTDDVPIENTLKKQISSISLNQQANLGIITEKQIKSEEEEGEGDEDEEKTSN